ncbi:endonuclease MutS2 [Tannerella sp. oral taxon 808]|nr:endonuclease MutS2 [Tannerella sp. oral taxon 808]
MIYPDNFEHKLGFDKIRELIAAQCLSSLGREQVDGLRFSPDAAVVAEELEQTGEFVRILQGERAFPANYFIDVRPTLSRIRPEGTFADEAELFDLKRSLQTIADITRFFLPVDKGDDAAAEYPVLAAIAGRVPIFPDLIRRIDAILDRYGRTKDSASPELARIRRDMATVSGSISRNLQSILRAAQTEGWVDRDTAPTMRDGRLVIPVAPSFKRRIRGIVHDESATGKTVYIEPEAVVEANNRIRELEAEERREIVRILTAFTDVLRPLVPDILQSYAFLAVIDFIRAKALFAESIGAIVTPPKDEPLIDWQGAVHPLLLLAHRKAGKEVVPLDITLDTEHRLLIISGPNAGGKSVCLKTVGLLQYMLQCGIPIPLHERSRTGLFERIFIDIGDEQSIENDLSTYSSHLTNMKYFVRYGNERTLLLIDEFGSGTEPLIGGALAEALLERFNRRHSFGVITTHYQNLKQYAEDHEGVVNGAMLYDRNLMQPLFRLSVGHPGSSFAIEIARKIGLPDDVITEASEKVGSDYVDMDKYLQDIVRDKRYWENKRQNIRRREKQLEELTTRYERDLEAVNSQRKAIISEAKEVAQRIVGEANARIENTIREIREAQAEKERTRTARRELDTFKETVSQTREDDDRIARKMEQLRQRQERRQERKKRPEAAANATPKAAAPPPLTAGDAVRMKGQTAVGSILEMQGKQAVVAFGAIKSTVAADRLERADAAALRRTAERSSTFLSEQTADAMHKKRLHFRQEIDVRGMRGDEALQTVAYFIDDAIQVGADRVRILHGTGNGILRQLIRQYLPTVPGVAHFADEDVRLGGAGITVVDLE